MNTFSVLSLWNSQAFQGDKGINEQFLNKATTFNYQLCNVTEEGITWTSGSKEKRFCLPSFLLSLFSCSVSLPYWEGEKNNMCPCVSERREALREAKSSSRAAFQKANYRSEWREKKLGYVTLGMKKMKTKEIEVICCLQSLNLGSQVGYHM